MHKENTRTGLTLEKNGVTFESRLIRQNVVFAHKDDSTKKHEFVTNNVPAIIDTERFEPHQLLWE